MKDRAFCEQLIKYVGGKENIQSVQRCMTRLRFKLKKRSLANTKKIMEMDDVIDVISNVIAYQVVIGMNITDIYTELMKCLGHEIESNAADNKNPIATLFDGISGAMTSLIELFFAVSIISSIMTLLVLCGFISTDNNTYAIYMSVKNAMFYFFPIFIAYACSRTFNANPFLAVSLASVLLYSNINAVERMEMFGIRLPRIIYTNSFFPVIFGIWFMGYINKLTEKILPSKYQYFFKSAIVLAISVPATLIVFGPFGNLLGIVITNLSNELLKVFGGWIVTSLYAAFQPVLIMLGAGNFIVPVSLNFYTTYGYDPVFGPAAMVSDIAVCGAMIGYLIKSRDMQRKQLFATTSISAFLGITEPAIYGVFIKYRRPFIAVIIGGGLGGLYAGIFKVKAYTMAGVLGITTYLGNHDYQNLTFAIISVCISFFVSMLTSFLLGVPDEKHKSKEQGVNDKSALDDITDGGIESCVYNNISLNKIYLFSPLKGRIVELSKIGDKVFSSGALGMGLGILPMENEIRSPIDAEIVFINETYHAIGLKTSNGLQLMLHIGIDTVNLEGRYLHPFVTNGDYVNRGQILIKVDFESIIKENYDPTVLLIVTNPQEYLDIIPEPERIVESNENCITIIC